MERVRERIQQRSRSKLLVNRMVFRCTCLPDPPFSFSAFHQEVGSAFAAELFYPDRLLLFLFHPGPVLWPTLLLRFCSASTVADRPHSGLTRRARQQTQPCPDGSSGSFVSFSFSGEATEIYLQVQPFQYPGGE